MPTFKLPPGYKGIQFQSHESTVIIGSMTNGAPDNVIASGIFQLEVSPDPNSKPLVAGAIFSMEEINREASPASLDSAIIKSLIGKLSQSVFSQVRRTLDGAESLSGFSVVLGEPWPDRFGHLEDYDLVESVVTEWFIDYLGELIS